MLLHFEIRAALDWTIRWNIFETETLVTRTPSLQELGYYSQKWKQSHMETDNHR